MNILNVENVSKSYMSKPVLEGVSVGVNDTDKIGIVGTNGTGKSTLLSIVAGVVEPDSGKVVISNGLRISYLPQNPVCTDRDVKGVIHGAGGIEQDHADNKDSQRHNTIRT